MLSKRMYYIYVVHTLGSLNFVILTFALYFRQLRKVVFFLRFSAEIGGIFANSSVLAAMRRFMEKILVN